MMLVVAAGRRWVDPIGGKRAVDRGYATRHVVLDHASRPGLLRGAERARGACPVGSSCCIFVYESTVLTLTLTLPQPLPTQGLSRRAARRGAAAPRGLLPQHRRRGRLQPWRRRRVGDTQARTRLAAGVRRQVSRLCAMHRRLLLAAAARLLLVPPMPRGRGQHKEPGGRARARRRAASERRVGLGLCHRARAAAAVAGGARQRSRGPGSDAPPAELPGRGHGQRPRAAGPAQRDGMRPRALLNFVHKSAPRVRAVRESVLTS